MLDVRAKGVEGGELGPALGTSGGGIRMRGELDEDAVLGIAVLAEEGQGLLVGIGDLEDAGAGVVEAAMDRIGNRGIDGVAEARHGIGFTEQAAASYPCLIYPCASRPRAEPFLKFTRWAAFSVNFGDAGGQIAGKNRGTESETPYLIRASDGRGGGI